MKEKFRFYYTNLRNFGQLFFLSRDTLSVMVAEGFGFPDNTAWAMLGLIWAKSCQLPSIVDEIPWKSKKPSKIQRLWRFIKNLNVIPKELALISAAEILSSFRGRIIYLTIDRTDIKDKWILFVAVSFRKRALPLIWKVLSKRGATSAKEQRDFR